MSLAEFWNRVRGWIPWDRERRRLQQMKDVVDGKPKKRKPFRSKVHLPWYSTDRPRNIVILAALGTTFLYWDTMVIVGKGAVTTYRIDKERIKYRRLLDEEDRIFEEQLAAGSVSEHLLKK